MSEHKLVYYNDKGMYQDTITDFFNLEYTRKENDYGSLYIDFPPYITPNTFRIDGMFEVLRSWDGGKFSNDSKTLWFVRLVRTKIDENGRKTTHIIAYDANQLIDRRIVAYKAKTAQASKKNVRADTLLKQVMRENFGSLATDPLRNISNYISVQADNANSTLPLITKAFAYQKILPLFQDICNEVQESGYYLTFDMVPMGIGKFEFQVFPNMRGADRGSKSKNPLIFTVDNGGLSYASLSGDYTEERNVVYAAGNGEESNRILQVVINTNTYYLSPFQRNEDFISTNESNPTSVWRRGVERVYEAAKKIVLNGHLQQVPGKMYGIDYGFGDIVNVQFYNASIDVHIDAVKVSVDDSQREEITINSRNFGDEAY